MEISDENKKIIDRIRSIRINTGLSQAKFAKVIGASAGNVGSWETYQSLPGTLALKSIALSFECSLDWLILGYEVSPKLNNQVVFDSAMRDMIDVVKLMMSDPDPKVRAWAELQFRRTFPEYFQIIEQKKEHA